MTRLSDGLVCAQELLTSFAVLFCASLRASRCIRCCLRAECTSRNTWKLADISVEPTCRMQGGLGVRLATGSCPAEADLCRSWSRLPNEAGCANRRSRRKPYRIGLSESHLSSAWQSSSCNGLGGLPKARSIPTPLGAQHQCAHSRA